MKSKLYVIRKYIKASSAADAIRKERKTPVDEIWLDEDWKKGIASGLAEAIGFSHPTEGDDSPENRGRPL